MRSITKVFIAAEVLDLITTFIGLYYIPGVAEGNPLFKDAMSMIVAKTLATFFVAWMLERYGGRSKIFWIVPIIAMIPVPWNIFVIIYSFIWL